MWVEGREPMCLGLLDEATRFTSWIPFHSLLSRLARMAASAAAALGTRAHCIKLTNLLMLCFYSDPCITSLTPASAGAHLGRPIGCWCRGGYCLRHSFPDLLRRSTVWHGIFSETLPLSKSWSVTWLQASMKT